MASLVVVAIPAEDDYVHKISSEKVPHCTLLYLGDDVMKVPNVIKILDFVEHAAEVWEQGPFMLEVDHRGTLGEDKADVLFFKKNWSGKKLEQFRWQLLQNSAIRTAYDNATQHEGEWIPHLTLGYPDSPAKEDERDYPGIRWVDFDRIALWFGDYEGPEFRLEYNDDLAEVSMSTTTDRGEEFIAHFGVKGMKWGVRKERSVSTSVRTDTGLVRRKTKVVAKGGESHPAHTDAIIAAVQKQKLRKSGTDALSTQELRELSTRLQLEAQVETLTTKKGKKFAKRQLETAGQQQIQRGIAKGVATGAAKRGGKAALLLA
jgi:2'-5' RNA ligase